MVLSAHVLLILTLTLGILPQEGWGSSLSGEQPGGVVRAAPHRIRAKRCSCNNPLDSECHYFCHLDIIWVNTPGKTTIYGLGSPLSRRRRSAHRCACANPADRTCAAFCQSSSENSSLLLVNPSTQFPDDLGRASSNLLASLRDAAHTNGWITHRGISTRKKPARDRKLRDR